MGLFGNKPNAGGFMDAIRCDEPEYLIWKWHPEGSEVGIFPACKRWRGCCICLYTTGWDSARFYRGTS